MTKTEAIAQITSTFPVLTVEQAQALAELAEAWTRNAPAEDAATRAAIQEGLAQADRGEFASEADVAAAFARFRSA